MEDLSRIEARLESLRELGELVRALRSMAAARAREAQGAFDGTRAYRATVERAVAEVSALVPGRSAAGGTGKEDAEGAAAAAAAHLLVVTSENGFVGGFNNRLIDAALEAREPGGPLIVVGRRGQTVLAERGVAPDLAVSMTASVSGVTALARRLTARLGSVGRASLVFARYRPGAAFAVETRPVLPLPAPPPEDRPASAPLHHLPPADLLDALAGEYLFAEIADALMESLAAENGARLRTMDAASRNIEDRLETLHRQERAARQEQTTADMIDVVTGAEAVNGNHGAIH